MTTHGGCCSGQSARGYDKLYHVWQGMKDRCYNPNNREYFNYGGRGIKVCEDWLDYSKFREFMIGIGYDYKAPRGTYTIERKDVNRDYTPENCIWADKTTQCFNRRKFEGTTSKYVGVSYDKTKTNKPWRVSLKKNGKIVFSGSFAIEEDAAKAYDEACFKHYGIRKNFPNESENT